MEILIDFNPETQTRTYNIIYDTSTGVFLSILDYEIATSKVSIRSLVLLDTSSFTTRPLDCSEI